MSLSMSSSYRNQHYAYPAPLPPPPINDPTTLIALRGFVSGQLAFRRHVSDFPAFDDIFLAAYEVWQNDSDGYRLHLHFCRGEGVQCSREDLLERAGWESGEYFVGGTIVVFAHFAKKRQALPEPIESARESERYSKPTRAIRRQNPDAITTYSLCQPTERQYFSAPFIFIPYPGVALRFRSRPVRLAQRWPSFRFQQDTTPTPNKQVHNSADPESQGGAASLHASATAPRVPALSRDTTAIEPQPPESDSDHERSSSPEYGIVEQDGPEEAEQTKELGRYSASRASESLFVPEQAERRESEESESLFIPE